MADAGNHFYYYIYNVQGDVIALADADTGKIVATYTYDAWGKCVSVENATGFTVGSENPFRFKGYYFDQETGLYYLNSRYYDPGVGRFVNADSLLTASVIGANLFAYCNDNPIMGYDPDGYFVDTIFDVISLGISVAEVCANPYDPWAWLGLAGDIIDLIPGVTGVGETVKVIKTTSRASKFVSDIPSVNRKIHANSLNSEKLTYGYAIVKKDTGKIMKYGETTRGVKRYSKSYYQSNNVSMVVIAKGTKREMHYWQHDRILEYYNENGYKPPWNKTFW